MQGFHFFVLSPVLFNDGDTSCRFNHGQACTAASRVFVHESVYDKFLPEFTQVLKSVKVGDPFQDDTYQGPQVHQVHYDVRILRLSFHIVMLSG